MFRNIINASRCTFIVRRQLHNHLALNAEHALSFALNTPFMGKTYASEIHNINALYKRFSENPRITSKFQNYVHSGAKCPHTGKNNPPHDFICIHDSNKQLSVKTVQTNKLWKICPQNIGQITRARFCSYFKLHLNSSDVQIKQFIEAYPDIIVANCFENTFHVPVLFYYKKDDVCLYIERSLTKPITWKEYQYSFSHIRKNRGWAESTSLSVNSNVPQYEKTQPLCEIQLHQHRNCVKFRFCLRTILSEFGDYFTVEKW